jgi:uncharacterized membrane protein YdcZ (DUF606 family)
MRRVRAAQPISALVGLVVLLIVLVTVVRLISARAGFLVERPIVFLFWLTGLLIAAAVFAWVIRRSMRRDTSRSSLLVLTLTVLALASPLALMLLQHPDPAG